MPADKHHTRLPDTKQILSDPIRTCSDFQPDNDKALTAIKLLWEKRQDLEKQHKALKTRTGILSRQIGEARKSNQSAEQLIASMKLASTEQKTLDKQIGHINEDILEYFSRIQTTPDKDRVQHDSSSSRHYSTPWIKAGDVHIGLFEKDSDPDEWNHYVSGNPAACIHHRAEWQSILSQSYGHNSLYLCARNDSNNIVGILPLVQMKSRLFGNKLVSLPFFQRGGAVADSPQIEAGLMRAASSYGTKLAVDYIEYRDDTPHDDLPEPSAIQTHKVNMVLSLPETQETLWQGFTSKLRAQIRRAQREKAEVFIGGREYLNDFYAVYSRNMRDLGSPVQSKKFINKILLHFPENSWLIIIKHKQRAVAAGLLLGSGDTMEIPLASTIRDVNHLSINMFLYWEILKFAIEQHYSHFDFGRSSKDAGTYRFKQQWGARPKQLYWHYWLGNSASPPSLNTSNPRFSLAIKLWQRLPVVVANLLGPFIVRNLP